MKADRVLVCISHSHSLLSLPPSSPLSFFLSRRVWYEAPLTLASCPGQGTQTWGAGHVGMAPSLPPFLQVCPVGTDARRGQCPRGKAAVCRCQCIIHRSTTGLLTGACACIMWQAEGAMPKSAAWA